MATPDSIPSQLPFFDVIDDDAFDSIVAAVSEAKVCRQCGVLKPLDEFGRNSGNRDGRQIRCKACMPGQYRQPRGPVPCTVPGCTEPRLAKGLCTKHYQRARYHEGDTSKPARPGACCAWECAEPIREYGLCAEHLRQWKEEDKRPWVPPPGARRKNGRMVRGPSVLGGQGGGGAAPSATSVCPTCKKVYPRTPEFFYTQKDSGDGLFHQCKECHNAKQKARKAAHRALVDAQREADGVQARPYMLTNEEGLHTCPRCNKTYPRTAEYFHKDKNRPDGLHYWCRACRNGGETNGHYQRVAPGELRTCPRCERTMPWTNEYFNRRRSRTGGLAYICKECTRYRNRQELPPWHQRRRLLVLTHYGGDPPACACCGETEIKFLAIDHPNNDGAAHRREIGGGLKMYSWLIQNNFPPGYRVLCHNCNCARGFYGTCSHEDKKVAAP